MILTLDLQADLEHRLQHEAGINGLDAESFVLHILQERLSPLPGSAQELSDTELLAEINRGLGPSEWARYRELIGKRQAEALSDIELAELINTTERLEETRAFRAQCLVELANRRHTTVDALMADLGLKPELHD